MQGVTEEESLVIKWAARHLLQSTAKTTPWITPLILPLRIPLRIPLITPLRILLGRRGRGMGTRVGRGRT
jgi:hypothetical protein